MAKAKPGLDAGESVGRAEPIGARSGINDLFPGLSRRRFIQVGALGALSLTLPGCTPAEIAQTNAFLDKIRNRPVRKNISTLTPTSPDIVAWKSAITQMKALPPGDCRSWTRQNQIHASFGASSHGNWFFFPWHRAYLHFFEEIVRELSGNDQFALPYWNWTQFPQIPAAFWGNPNPLFHPGRSATSNSPPVNAAFVGATTMLNILGQQNFLQFGGGPAQKGQLEGTPHDHVHGYVGGSMGSVPTAPLDPLFWAHHNMVEHEWWQWNLTQNHANPSNSPWVNKVFTGFCDRHGNPVQVSVNDTLSYPITKYRFDDLNIGI